MPWVCVLLCVTVTVLFYQPKSWCHMLLACFSINIFNFPFGYCFGICCFLHFVFLLLNECHFVRSFQSRTQEECESVQVERRSKESKRKRVISGTEKKSGFTLSACLRFIFDFIINWSARTFSPSLVATVCLRFVRERLRRRPYWDFQWFYDANILCIAFNYILLDVSSRLNCFWFKPRLCSWFQFTKLKRSPKFYCAFIRLMQFQCRTKQVQSLRCNVSQNTV